MRTPVLTCSLVTCHLSLPFKVIFQPDDVVLAEVVAQLDFDERQRTRRRIAEAMICLRRNVDVLAFSKLKLTVAANDISDPLDDNPMLAASRVTLEAQARAGFNFKPFNFIASAFLQNLVASPRPLICFSSHNANASREFDFDIDLRLNSRFSS